MVASKYSSQRIFPEDNLVHTFEWAGEEYQYEFVSVQKTPEREDTTERHIILSCKNAQPLLLFPKQLNRVYTESLDKEEWAQLLYTHSAERGNLSEKKLLTF